MWLCGCAVCGVSVCVCVCAVLSAGVCAGALGHGLWDGLGFTAHEPALDTQVGLSRQIRSLMHTYPVSRTLSLSTHAHAQGGKSRILAMGEQAVLSRLQQKAAKEAAHILKSPPYGDFTQ